jgi:hypothetical protein
LHQVELFSKADNVIVMDHGKFKYCGPYNAQAIRKLFPNAHVPEVGQTHQNQHQPNPQNNAYMRQVTQPEAISFGSDVPAGLPYPPQMHQVCVRVCACERYVSLTVACDSDRPFDSSVHTAGV